MTWGGPAQVMVAMSGGVDSSVAAALLLEAGHRVTGVTMKLWGGDGDSGCCSVADVEDARRAAQQLGIDHHVFNFGDDFLERVVEPYVAEHSAGRTPNPCIECNRHLKFDRLMRRADALGFDLVATGHHARVASLPGGALRVQRAVDGRKDQSYVLHMLGQDQLARLRLPVGEMPKQEVRAIARRLGLRTASKPDSQDVCFIRSDEGRRRFLGSRIRLAPGRVVDTEGREVGSVPALELVTVGQRRGLGLSGTGAARYVTDVDLRSRTATVGTQEDLLVEKADVRSLAWAEAAVEGQVEVQCSAHGQPLPARIEVRGDDATLRWEEPQPRVAPGQSVVFYRGDLVEGGGIAA